MITAIVIAQIDPEAVNEKIETALEDDQEFQKKIDDRKKELDELRKEIEEIKIELIDRFGKLPKQLINLLKLVEIKIICLKNNIEKFEFSRKGILISFFQNKPKNPEKLLELSLSKNSSLILRPDQKIFYDFGGNLIDDRFELSKNVINLIK